MKRIFSCSAAPKIPLEKLTKNDRKLRSAVDNGDMVKLSSLLLKRTVVPTKLDPEGRSPFHLAASKGATGCLDLMLVYGVDLNAQDCEGCNALHLAVRNGRLGCVRSLLKYNVPVKETDFSGRTALHYAAMSGCISSAKLLCDHGASIDPFDRESRTPLMVAARMGRPEICRLLTEQGAAVDATDSKHKTALILACESDCPEVVDVLLSAGADVGMVDDSGRDAGHYGQQSRSERLRDLMRAGAEPNQTAVPGRAEGNHCQDPTDLHEGPTPVTSPAESLESLQGKAATDQEPSGIGSKGDEAKEEVRKLQGDLARKISECEALAEESERVKRRVSKRLRIFIQALERPENIQEGGLQGTDLAEVGLLMDRLGQQLGILRGDLERTRKETRHLQEQVKRESLERGKAGKETEGPRAKNDGDIERLQLERDKLAEEKHLAERRFMELEGHLDNMRAVLSQYQTRKRSQSKQVEDLEMQTSDLTRNNEELTTLVRHLQEELKSKKDKEIDIAPLKDLGDALEETETTPGRLRELLDRCSELQKEKEVFEKELERLRGRIQTDFVHLEVLDETTRSWKTSILDLKETIREMEQRYMDLQMEAQQLQGENLRLRERNHKMELGYIPLVRHEEEMTRLQDTVTGLQSELGKAKRKLNENSQGRKALEAENAKVKTSLDEARSEIGSLKIREGAIVSLERTISALQSELLEKQKLEQVQEPRARTGQSQVPIQELDQACPSETFDELEREICEQRMQKDAAKKNAARLEKENKNLRNNSNALQDRLRVEFVPESRYKELEGPVEERKRHSSELSGGLRATQEADRLGHKSEAEWAEIQSFGQSLQRAIPQEDNKARAEIAVIDLKGKHDSVQKDQESLENDQQRPDFTTTLKRYICTQHHEDLKNSMRKEAMGKLKLQGELVKAQEERETPQADLAKQKSSSEHRRETGSGRPTDQIESAEKEGAEQRPEASGSRRELERKASGVAAVQDREDNQASSQARGLDEGLRRTSAASEDSCQQASAAKEERRMGEEDFVIAAKQLETLREKCDKLERDGGNLREEVKRYAGSCFEKEEQIREMLSDIERLSHERETFQHQTNCLEQKLKEAKRRSKHVISIYRSHLLNAVQGVMDEEVYLVLIGILKMERGLVYWREEEGDAETQSG